jgi:hypothetical protein
MSEMSHDSLDFLTVLEVEPAYDEDAFCVHYRVERDGLLLVLTTFLGEPRAELTLKQTDQPKPLVHFSCWVWGEARRVLDKRGESLEFLGCTLGNIWNNERPKSEDSLVQVQLWIKPQISLELH